MEYYNKIVPHILSPDIGFYTRVILPAISAPNAIHFLPRIWTDLCLSDFVMVKKDGRCEVILKILQLCYHVVTEDQSLKDCILKICDQSLVDVMADPLGRSLPLSQNLFATPICNFVILIALQEKQFPLAKKAMSFCFKEISDIPKNLDEETVQLFVKNMIAVGDKEAVNEAVSYSVEAMMPKAEAMGRALATAENIELETSEKNRLNSMFSHNITWELLK